MDRSLGDFEGSDAYTETEKDVLRFATRWTGERGVANDVIERLELALSSTHLVVLAATVAQANFTSRFNNTFVVELP
jgi:hypothetical protein